MSHDGENDTDTLASSGASCALCLTDAPFQGPLGTVRVGRIITDDGATFVIDVEVGSVPARSVRGGEEARTNRAERLL